MNRKYCYWLLLILMVVATIAFLHFSVSSVKPPFAEEEEFNVCQNTTNATVPHPTECRVYYECPSGKRQLCDLNTCYNKITGECDTATCRNPECAVCEGVGFGNVRDNTSCYRFFLCTGSDALHLECFRNECFDPTIRTCTNTDINNCMCDEYT